MKVRCRLYPLPITFALLLLAFALLLFGATAVQAGEASEPSGPALGSPSGPQGKPAQDADSAKAEPASKETDESSEKNDAPADKDDESAEKADEATSKTKSAGEPLAPGMVTLLQQEISKALKKRNVYSKYNQFRSFAGGKLSSSTRPYTGSELAGNCRLKWYDHLLRNPLKAPAEAEEFTRQLHLAAQGDHKGLDEILAIAGKKLDLADREPREFDTVDSPQQAIEVVKRALTDCQLAYCQALAPLSKSEIRMLNTNLYPILTANNRVGHTLSKRSTGRQLCNLLEKKLNRKAMHRAAESLVPLADPQLLEQLGTITGNELVAVPGVTGRIARRINTPSGGIVIGGRGKNTYQLEKMPNVNVVIDLGGDDIYYEGTCSLHRPVMITIDLDGNDAYEAKRPGVQGSAILGIAMLLDVAGNDVYRAKDVAQGACVAGAGILIDYAGDDSYVALRRAQGEALGGVGILIDRAGNDRYHAAMWAQGMGGPLGFGLLDDLDGKDHYYCGGLYLNSYLDDDSPTPGYEGWGQGVGGGLRAVTNGGIGVILDGGGDDIYEADYLSHGGGYWCGIGFARDFGGNDQRLGATRKAYSGGARTQRRFVRFSNGFAVHYALGFLFDDEGNDTYNSTIMGVGYGWDCAVAYLCDFGGDDRYSGNEGVGAQASLGVLYDFDGKDVYLGSRQGRASSGISYHPMPRCGGNFSFVIDYGGTDKYGSGARNNSFIQRGSWGGFLIDRPKQDEIDKTADKPKHRSTKGS